MEQGVEVKRAVDGFEAGGRSYAAGDYVIPLAQPAKRLIRTLLDPQVALDERFVREQERRRRQKLPHQMYDVTAWSMPLLYNVECVARPEVSAGKFEPAIPARIIPAEVHADKATVAYLVPWGSAAAVRLLAAAHVARLHGYKPDKPFTPPGATDPP